MKRSKPRWRRWRKRRPPGRALRKEPMPCSPIRTRTSLKRTYHTLDNQGKVNQRKLAEFLAQNGQQLLPMVELTESQLAIDDLVSAMGRATIETVLQLSAEQV